MNVSPVVLLIFDGFGVNPSRLNNGWQQAKTPHLDQYFATNPHTVLQSSGLAVGLPDGQFGNSEVGHLTLGSGRILDQDLLRIADGILDGALEKHPAWKTLVEGARVAHLVGLLSDGGVHSHIEHLLALLPLLEKRGIQPCVHAITDGRDTPPRSALKYVRQLEERFAQLGAGRIVTVSGRYYSMDRAGHYDRTEKAWRAMLLGEGQRAESAEEAIARSYDQGVTDEFIIPTVIGQPSPPVIKPDEPVLFFNFRSDRARQLAAAIGLEEFDGFDRGEVGPRRLVCMTRYNEKYRFPVLFQSQNPEEVLAEVISRAGLRQFHCAETEKYPHVTYFFNGGNEKPFPGEDRERIPSPQVETYDQAPEMSTRAVADRMIEAINSGEYHFLLSNFANGDMVGHTADQEAVIRAVETLDRESHRVIQAALKKGARVMITSDHGNCDELIDPHTGQRQTQHSVFPSPFLLIGERDARLGIGRGLADVAPTVLDLLGLAKPSRMTGRSLILGQSLL
ncbi:MAG TPA: 2,3-bisphosphoglycerate-independent phosphoglycerate mutase [Gammaproteobacteria bacterium]|nr:2,3-bisphosphoglycerate-independent phosphoglycerate mutase [Gammaproteobacteria bacterium]